jgi:dTDP-4-dehydrorhamnose reductase
MILITGANGFLGYYLTDLLLKKGLEVTATGKGKCRLPFSSQPGFHYLSLDFTDPFSVHDVFEHVKPTVVVHAGAMSKPDECELNQWQCYENNVQGTLNLLANAEECKSYFLFVSTDFVFSGEEGMYKEDDKTNPVNFYGQSKADAEDAVKEYPCEWSIVRTVLVYGNPVTGKQNLLTIVKDKLEKGETYKVVNDQVRTPTYVGDLAIGISDMIEKKATGIYHLSGEDVLTPYDMACQTADYFGLDKSLLFKVDSSIFSQPAKRPLKTGLAIEKAKRAFNYHPLSFHEGLIKMFG